MKQKATLNLKQLLDGFAETLESASELLSLGQLLAANRGRLGQALAQGSIVEARTIVKRMCEEHPAVAGVVNYIMTQDVDRAISAVEMYDAKLATQLRANRVQFSELQKQWASSRKPDHQAARMLRACGTKTCRCGLTIKTKTSSHSFHRKEVCHETEPPAEADGHKPKGESK